jgi:PHD/YefM family antitoxin component YafN of YafNO toxin-antitoxin module
MYKTEDIHSLSDFVRNTRRHIDRLRETKRPEILTVNGSAELVVQDAEAYQELLDKLDEAETLLALEEAEADIARGDVTPASIALPRLRKRLGLPARR